MRTPPLLADFSHARVCKPFCENFLTLPSGQRTAEYTKLKETRAEVAELHNIRKCVDIALKADQPEQTRTKQHDLER